MTLISKSLPRRTVLRGIGATLALPFLDAMAPAVSSVRAAAKPAQRFQAFYTPNGMAMPYWTPEKEGTDFALSPILEPLAPFKDQVIVLSGLSASWNHIHAGASGSFLTGMTRGGRNETEILGEVSMDQLLARHFARDTQVASLAVAMDRPNNAGACTGNLSCVYTHTISWRSQTQPLPMEWNPRAVFETLFGDSGSTEREARQARLRQHKSLLDAVTGKLTDLKRELGVHDQVKLDEYTESVRDVERRIQRAEEQSDLELPELRQPQGAPPVFEDHLELMLDLQLLAFQSDLTRVITFMIGKEQSPRPYRRSGSRRRTTRSRTTTTCRSWSRTCRRSTATTRSCSRSTWRSCGRPPTATATCSTTRPSCMGRVCRTAPATPATTCRSCWSAAGPAGCRAGGTSATETSRRWPTCCSR